jgi:alpha-L-rhamnosidase
MWPKARSVFKRYRRAGVAAVGVTALAMTPVIGGLSPVTAGTAGKDQTENVSINQPSGYNFQGSWIRGPQRDSWPLTSAQGAWDDGCCTASSTTLAGAAATGSTEINPVSYTGLFPGDSMTVGTGANAQTVTITSSGPSPAGATQTALDAPAGASNLPVSSTANFVVGAPITVGAGSSAQSAVVTAVGSSASTTTLFSAASPGDSQLYVSSLAPLVKNTELVIGTGAGAQTTTVIGTNGAAPGPTTLAAPASASDTMLYVNSVTGMAPRGPLVIGTGSSAVTVYPKYVGTAAGAPTTLLSAASAGDTQESVANNSGFTAGLPALIGSQEVTVSSVSPSISTTLASAATQGAAIITVTSANGLVAGGTLTIGSGFFGGATATIASISGNVVTLTAGLSAAEAAGAAVTEAGTQVSFTPALTAAEPAGTSADGLGGGITLSQPLGSAFPAGTGVQGAGLGILVKPAIDAGFPAGTQLLDAGQGIGFTPALSAPVAAGSAVTAGTGVSFTPALTADHPAGDAVATTPGDFCRPVTGNADNQGSCQEIRPAPLLRKAFDVLPARQHGPIVSAELYYSGLGYGDMSMNGQSVNPADVLDPSFTNYTDTVYYQVSDVTSLLQQSRSQAEPNVIGAELGSGQYDDDTDGGNWGWVTAPWRATPELIANLWITYADGTRQLIETDPSWQVSLDGPVRYDGYYIGETYDARKALPGWNTPGYDASGPQWQQAMMATPPLGTLTYQQQTPTEAVATWPVGTPTSPSPGIEAYDIGTLRTGFATLEVYGAPAGTPIRIMYSDKDLSNGLPDTSGCCINDQPIQTDYYVSNGTGTAANPEVWTPQFTVKATRYIEISGPGGAPLPAGVTAVLKNFTEVRAALTSTGTFSTSNSIINGTYAAAEASIAANYFGGIVTDTPEYEKNPWQGDTSLSSSAADLMFNTDSYDAGEVLDQAECQTNLGELVQVCPNSGTYGYLYHSPDGGFIRGPSTGSTPIWDSAAFTIPWNEYMVSGDKSLLTASFPTMENYLDNWLPQFGRLSGSGSQYVLTAALGDWDPPAGTDGSAASGTNISVPSNNASTTTAYYGYLAEIASWTAQALGDRADAVRYHTLYENIAAAFNQQWWNPSLGYYDETAANGLGDTTTTEPFEQTINALALAFGFVPAADRVELENQLVNDIMVTRSGHEEVGIVGAAWLLPVLSQAAADGVPEAATAAYTLVTQTTYPSYGYWTSTLGWTGLGEIWESDSRTRSHEMFGSVAAWMYEGLAGLAPAGGQLSPNPKNPGFKEITFAPTVPAGLSQASASDNTARGPVSASWQVNGSTLTMQETVPPGSRGLVYVPAANRGAVTATGRDVRYVGQDGARLIYRIGSGSYTFTVSGFTPD